MSQGLTEAPTYFSQTLSVNLKDLVFPCSSSLIQNVDHLLVCSVHFNNSFTATQYLPRALAHRDTRYLGTNYNYVSHKYTI